jgi:hypothetical protein
VRHDLEGCPFSCTELAHGREAKKDRETSDVESRAEVQDADRNHSRGRGPGASRRGDRGGTPTRSPALVTATLVA